MRLQKVLKQLNIPIIWIRLQIEKVRKELYEAQKILSIDRINVHNIVEVKHHSESLVELNEIEEKMMRQKAKIDWIRLGDENNSYFHASLKSKNSQKNIKALKMEDGTTATTQGEMEQEILTFYGLLMGSAETTLQRVDIIALRKGSQLSRDQRAMLISRVDEKEIKEALNNIGDLKALGVDGFGAKFFKKSWQIVRQDILDTVQNFF
ncbi:uncharacterized protein LOC131597268 [Vicia villosa]|uniref:uncharacterized protein LOC131597268 n=1 Tax=Vicia villosa TaxID=3911 RepID=UPI00273C16B2|nr:uncharacterized protein LOC131597268 [Vicia villosa]